MKIGLTNKIVVSLKFALVMFTRLLKDKIKMNVYRDWSNRINTKKIMIRAPKSISLMRGNKHHKRDQL